MKKYENEIKKYLKERGWDNLRPVDVAKSIAIESSELLEIFQWSNQDLEEVKKDKKQIEEIKKELADVLIYCFDMGVLLNFDMGEIFLSKLEMVRQKYPAHLFKTGDKKVNAHSQSIYLKIKKEHRNKNRK